MIKTNTLPDVFGSEGQQTLVQLSRQAFGSDEKAKEFLQFVLDNINELDNRAWKQIVRSLNIRPESIDRYHSFHRRACRKIALIDLDGLDMEMQAHIDTYIHNCEDLFGLGFCTKDHTDFLAQQAAFLSDLHGFMRSHSFLANFKHDDMLFPSGTHHEYQIFPDKPNESGTKVYIDIDLME